MAYTWSRVFERSNAYVPSASHRAAHLSSSPSRLGFSGTVIGWSLGRHQLTLDLGADHGADGDPQQDVERQPEHAGELLLRELEHLGDEDLDEHAALEPAVRRQAVVPEPHDTDDDQRTGDPARDDRRPLLESPDPVVVGGEHQRDDQLQGTDHDEPPGDDEREPPV